ncbi:MAG: hypothetical protein Tsb0020_27490 [Haliangiales bacterium]
MQLRIIALAVATTAALVALMVLFVQVRAEPDVVVPPDELDQARALYQRSQAARPAKSPPPPIPSARKVARRAPEPEPVADDPPPEPQPPRTMSRRLPPNLAASKARQDELKPQRDIVRAAYDSGRFEDALEASVEYLRTDPSNRYVQRSLVVSACALGDESTARQYYERMVDADKRTVEIRCGRYSFTF